MNRAKYVLGLLGASLSVGCSGAGDGAIEGEAEAVAETEQPVINGINSVGTSGAVAIYHTTFGYTCTGSLIRRRWVLTARHCVTVDNTPGGTLDNAVSFRITSDLNPQALIPAGQVIPPNTTGASQIRDHATEDLAILSLASPHNGPLTGLWDGTYEYYQPFITAGTATIRMMGYGRFQDTAPTGVGLLREATMKATSIHTARKWLRTQRTFDRMLWRGDSGGPGLLANLVGNAIGVASVHRDADMSTGINDDYFLPTFRSWVKKSVYTPGDTNQDRRGDITLTGASGWTTIPVATFASNGTISVVSQTVTDFPAWAAAPGSKEVSGDFNGDGKLDLAITGPSGWTTLPVAHATSSGSFTVTNAALSSFPGWAATTNAKAVPGDFDGDGFDDIALTGPSTWQSIRVAYGNGDGTFTPRIVGSTAITTFAGWAAVSGAKPIAGDFNGDGRGDIALVGVSSWTTVPIAFGEPNRSFFIKNEPVSSLPAFSSASGVKIAGADVDGDGRDDMVLTGVSSWTTTPIARSLGDGRFDVTNPAAGPNWASWAATANVKLVAGDFNGDGKDDIALTGASGWASIPVGYSQGATTFSIQNPSVTTDFANRAAQSGVTVLSGYKTF